MSNQEPVYAYENELDLREIIEVLWHGKWIIIGTVVFAILAAWFGSHLFLSPTYEATATLLIMPPTYQTSIEPEPLALETYRNLALTPSIASEIVKKLSLTDDKGEALSPGALLDHLSAALFTANRTPDEAEVTGVIKLTVSWNDPQVARDIANAWANTFMENASQIRKGESDEVSKVILQQFSSTKDALQQSEDEYLKFQAANHISLVTQNVEKLRSQLGKYRDSFLELQHTLETKRNQLETLDSQLTSLEEDGLWVGLLTRELSGIEHRDVLPRKQAIQAAIELQKAQEALNSFENKAQIDLIRQQLQQDQQILAGYRKNLADLQANRPQLANRLEKLETALEKQDPKLVLSRSMTNDALWLGLTSNPEIVDRLGKLKLDDESLNPNYQYLERQLLDTQVQSETVPSDIETYQRLIDEKTVEISQRQATLRELEKEKTALQNQLAICQQYYDALQKQYNELRQQRAALLVEVGRLESELAAAEEALKRHEDRTSKAEQELHSLQLQDERLTRSISALKQTHTRLAEHAETARLTALQTTGDVRFVSPAVVPTSPTGPRYMLNTAIAAFLAAMVSVMLVFLMNMMKAPRDVKRFVANS